MLEFVSFLCNSSLLLIQYMCYFFMSQNPLNLSLWGGWVLVSGALTWNSMEIDSGSCLCHFFYILIQYVDYKLFPYSLPCFFASTTHIWVAFLLCHSVLQAKVKQNQLLWTSKYRKSFLLTYHKQSMFCYSSKLSQRCFPVNYIFENEQWIFESNSLIKSSNAK